MTYLNTIIEAEKEAENNLERGRQEAVLIVDEAKKKASEGLEKTKESFKDVRAKQLSTQKEALKKMYKDILAEGFKRAQGLEKRAEENKAKAVENIVRSLL
ncbi:MAG: hypothetical protein Q8P86_01285 [bacterium]|nr:hypothetical protein [bacterium]